MWGLDHCHGLKAGVAHRLEYYVSVRYCGWTFEDLQYSFQPNFPLVYPILGHRYTLTTACMCTHRQSLQCASHRYPHSHEPQIIYIYIYVYSYNTHRSKNWAFSESRSCSSASISVSLSLRAALARIEHPSFCFRL